MLSFLVLPKIPDIVETLLDATLLTLMITPSLYFFCYLPLSKEISKRAIIEKELRNSENYLKQRTQKLEQTMQQLQQAPKLLLAEKISGLGQVVAGVAHEINNPINFIYANLPHVREYGESLVDIIQLYQRIYPQVDNEIASSVAESDLDFTIQDLPKLLSSMQAGADRIRKIVLALRNFSRFDEAKVKAVNIHDGIDSTILLLQYRLKSKIGNSQIKIVKNYSKLPLVKCEPGQLNQVFMNIINNAIDVLQQENANVDISELENHVGIITISTQRVDQDWVQISIKDNGPGITEENRAHLFEPFFTTKPVGQGIGLGLSISYQIITHHHGGRLECVSQPGRGAEFIIQMPLSSLTSSLEDLDARTKEIVGL
ncbi:hypothetical protein NSMS1_39900 [Nostoc sp. MS1]|nr:hypothetical protein NSMS1_39900 [Nostoc sp. MS1]